MRNYCTLSDVTSEYYREHPDEIDEFLKISFEEFVQDGDMGALLSALRIVSHAKGITAAAEAARMFRKGLQKALSEDGNLQFASINTILKTLVYGELQSAMETSLTTFP